VVSSGSAWGPFVGSCEHSNDYGFHKRRGISWPTVNNKFQSVYENQELLKQNCTEYIPEVSIPQNGAYLSTVPSQFGVVLQSHYAHLRFQALRVCGMFNQE
jgi:hypothetical protein